MNDPQLLFAEPPHTRHWALVDVVAAGLTWMAWTTQVAASGPTTPMGPGWTAVRYLAAVAGCASIVFRWRFPVTALGVAGGSAALFNALAGHFGCSHGSVLACIPVALTVYAVVSASARRAVPVIVGAAVAAMEAGAAMAAGGPDAATVLSAPTLAVVGARSRERPGAPRL
jgi:hypothetical protein